MIGEEENAIYEIPVSGPFTKTEKEEDERTERDYWSILVHDY